MTRRELELRDQRAEIEEKAHNLLERAERRGLTGNEEVLVKKYKADLEDLDKQINEAIEEGKRQHEQLDREFGTVRNANGEVVSTRSGKGSEQRTRVVSATDPLETRSHRELCERCEIDPEDMNEWESDEHFYSALLRRQYDPRLFSHRSIAGMSTLIPADGGAIVPLKVAGRILDLALESEVVRSRARVYPILKDEGRSLKIPLWNVYDRSSGNISGSVRMSMVAEGGEIPTSKPKLESVAFDLKKGAIMVPITNELIEDGGSRFYGDLEAAIAAAIAFGRDDLLLNGVGGAQPLGALLSPNKIVVSKETGQTAATVLSENIPKMMSRMLPSSLVSGAATWVAHPGLFPSLSLLSYAIGTAGVLTRMLEGDARSGFRLHGLPLVFSEKCQVLGTEGDLSLIDFSRYGVAERPGMSMALSPHVGFTTDQVYLRVTVRFDGRSLDPTATQPKNGSTFSSVVTLETRS